MDSKLKIVLGNVYAFGVYGIFYGAIVGALNGVLAGATMGFLIVVTGVPLLQSTPTPTAPGDWPTAILAAFAGGQVGAMFLAVVGIAASIPAWIITGITHWSRGEDDVIRDALRGTIRASLLMTLAGAFSGVLLHMTWLHLTSRPIGALQMALNPRDCGFFWGSIIGCAFGMFFGAIFGARSERSWLNVPIREMPNEIHDGVLRLIQTR